MPLRSLLIAGAAVSLVASAPSIAAHHAAPVQFDPKKPVILRGTLTEMKWANPHGWMTLDVRDSEEKVVCWLIETVAPNTLLRFGWRRSDLMPGTGLIVEGVLARDGSLTVHATRIRFHDGRVLWSESAPLDGRDGLRNRRR